VIALALGIAWLSVSAVPLPVAAMAQTALPAEGPELVQTSGERAEQERPTFAEWLQGVRHEALERGIRQQTIDEALAIDEPLAIVLDRDRSQTEEILPLETYVARRLTTRVVRTGRGMIDRHKAVLDRVEERYGVPGRIAVAIWGIESNFGRFSGVRPIVTALATLAWDPRRSMLFRSELFEALTIIDRGDVELARLRGSWAGAMGQPQFMPSSYLRYAQDFDGDGRRDIWTSVPDVLASIANYLRERGWSPGVPWGQEIALPASAAAAVAAQVPKRTSGCRAMREMTDPLPVDRWRELGVRGTNGRPLRGGSAPLSLVSGTRRHFLVSGNYEAVLEYNCAHAYALSVLLLADRIAQAPRASSVRSAQTVPERAADRAAVEAPTTGSEPDNPVTTR
jgi:membrane-bound lytic murein transglycosylase B